MRTSERIALILSLVALIASLFALWRADLIATMLRSL